MSLPANSQSLIAAFTFGIVFQAGAGAFFLYISGQGKKIFRDGLRLALITFISSSVLWSQISFSATLIEPSAAVGCQVAVISASLFDQLARFAIEQYLLWAINSGLKKAPDTFVPQALLVIRGIVGGIFVGFQRPQLFPVCQTSNNASAVGIAVAASDAVIILIFVVRVFMIGLVQDVREKRPGFQRSKAVIFLLAGLALWTGTSVPMFLGIQTIDLIFRTALPAGALSILLGLVTAFMGVLVMSRARASVVPQDPTLPPDMRSPGVPQSRDISSAESNYPPGRFEDLKADEAGNVTAYPSGKQVVVSERAINNAVAFPAATAYAPAAGATIGVAVGRPSMDGRGLGTRSMDTPSSRDQLANFKAQPKPKGSIFARGAPASSITVGKLAISNPILQNQTENTALQKIATVDLATAAKMERERRDMATLQDAESLIAQRAAPLPPAWTHEEALRRTQSTKRKDVGKPSTEAVAPMPQMEPENLQPVPDEVVIASSLQPSPGAETLRRRSPRSPPQEFTPSSPPTNLEAVRKPSNASDEPVRGLPMASQSSRPLTIANMRGPPPQARSSPQNGQAVQGQDRPALPPTWPRQGSVDNNIRPSRAQTSRSPEVVQQAVSQPSPESQNLNVTGDSPEPTLQRRGTVGLPSNPRSRGLKTPGKEGTPQPTVMFMNQIEYNDPIAVQNIMQDAAGQPSAALPMPEPKGRESVLHRPRPIPRQSDKDRQFWPAEQSPLGHRRTRSGGSVVSRLREQPGSPPNLPPLPPAPKSAGIPLRPQPNDTRSMTFDEKMDLFFPAPKSAAASLSSRESIPIMPALPSAYLMESNNSTTARSVPNPSRFSSSTTKTSIRTQSILEIHSPARPPMPNTSKFSIDTFATLDKPVVDDRNSSWIIPAMPQARVRSEQSYEGVKRRSSPVLPVGDGTMSEFSDNRTRFDEETATNWGSVHSPVVMEAREVQVPVPKINPEMYKTDAEPRIRDLSVLDMEGGKEIMTIMLDPSVEQERRLTATSTTLSQSNWHHRVGDECATFSTRKERVTSRRMPPPTPLLLNQTSKNSFMITAAEPSPLESPEEALQAIQNQLRKLDVPDGSSSEDRDQRLRLLDDLEQEMGQQEDQWHEMQIGIHRDSLSTMQTDSRRVSQMDTSTPSLASSNARSQRSSLSAHREARRASRLQVPSRQLASDAGVEITLSPASRRRSLWERKLAEAGKEYSEEVVDYLAPKPAANYFTIPMAQLGSPTPPDTDSDNEEILRAREVLRRRNAPVAKLWKPESPLAHTAQSLLWAFPARAKPVAPCDIPGIDVRPAARKPQGSLSIASSHLWTVKSTFVAPARIATIGLWRGAPIPQAPVVQAKPPRPVTQRPPRKTKRVSALADIIENPEPLPNKRGTLGIFQFPWGEKSDTATVQARPTNMFMAMPGTMSTGGSAIRAALEARSKQLEQEEYSASFFDDYDEEGEEDDAYISEINEEDSDGEFDETTLWEIASLLKSNQVPSKYSLLPQRQEMEEEEESRRGEPVFEASEYEMDEDDVDAEEERPGLERQDSDLLGSEINDIPEPTPRTTTPSTPLIGLWYSKKRFSTVRTSLGLPQPQEQAWAASLPTSREVPRAKPRQSELEPLASTSLWAPSNVPVAPHPWHMWTPSITKTAPAVEAKTVKPIVQAPIATSMWVVPADNSVSATTGLFDPQHKRTDYRTSAAQPAALHTVRKLRKVDTPLASVSAASNLWMSSQHSSSKSTSTFWLAPAPAAEKTSPKTEMQVKTDAPRAAPIAAPAPSPASGPCLWTPVPVVSQNASRGLFTPGHGRVTYRTTSAEPAALQTIRRPRVSQEALQRLTSRELWTVNNSITYEYDWITIASVGPQSPSYASSSGQSTPISESSSVKTNSTMASSMAPSIVQQTAGTFPGPRFPAWWEPTEKPSRLSVLPEGPEEPKVTPVSKPMDPVERRAVRVPKPSASGTKRRPYASLADWDAALQQAVTAGNRFKHRKATQSDWDSALKSAMNASRPARMDATPADWDAALAQALATSTSTVKPSPTAALWSQSTTDALEPSNNLWAPTAVPVAPSSPLLTAQDDETSRLRRQRVQASVPKTRKAEIRAQIAAIEAGVDPSIVGLVNFRNESLWNPNRPSSQSPAPRGGGRDWIKPQAPMRASQAVFKFWLPGSGDDN